jgi:sugar phosphate isomerase/epimerase
MTSNNVVLPAETGAKLGLAHFTVLDTPPLELVELARSTGFSAIGLRLHPAFPGSTVYQIVPGSDLMREMRQRLSDSGIDVYDIEFVCIDMSFDPESLKPVLQSGAELGAKRLSVCGDDADEARLLEKFSVVCDIARENGMGVDLEVMPWRTIGSLGAAVKLIDDSGRANAGLLIDALHLSRSGGQPKDLAGIKSSLITSAQICDAASEKPRTTEALIAEARGGRLLPGEGALPLHDLLSQLPGSAVLSVEIPNGQNLPPAEHLNRIQRATYRLFKDHERVPSEA